MPGGRSNPGESLVGPGDRGPLCRLEHEPDGEEVGAEGPNRGFVRAAVERGEPGLGIVVVENLGPGVSLRAGQADPHVGVRLEVVHVPGAAAEDSAITQPVSPSIFMPTTLIRRLPLCRPTVSTSTNPGTRPHHTANLRRRVDQVALHGSDPCALLRLCVVGHAEALSYWWSVRCATPRLSTTQGSSPMSSPWAAVSVGQRTTLTRSIRWPPITASLFIALDGVVDPASATGTSRTSTRRWARPSASTHDADVMLFGRVTYDSFAGAWPEREAAGGRTRSFAKQLGDMRKIVASRSPLHVHLAQLRAARKAISSRRSTALKHDPPIRRIALSGSVSVVRQLLDAGLLDELHLFVHPATAGSGLRLFEDGATAAPPRAAARRRRSGRACVHLVYAPDPNPPTGSYEEAKETLPQE